MYNRLVEPQSQSNTVQESAEPQYDHNLSMLADICNDALPVWAKQIESAKQLTDTSIHDLSVRFYGLSKRIQEATSTSVVGQDQGGLLALLAESQQQLNYITTVLNNMMEERQTLMRAIVDLKSWAKDLKSMAEVVNLIARETSMVAINAAIEAAHVGEKGRGFAVVADSVRRLSSDAARTGRQIAEKVQVVTQAIDQTAELSKDFEEKDNAMAEHTQEIIKKVVSQFSDAANELLVSSDKLRHEGQFVNQEISEVLVFLQFQDRVTQMLASVQDNLMQLQTAVVTGETLPDHHTWLNNMAASYTMKEQYEIHAQVTGMPLHKNYRSSANKPNAKYIDDSGSIGQTGSDEITFF